MFWMRGKGCQAAVDPVQIWHDSVWDTGVQACDAVDETWHRKVLL